MSGVNDLEVNLDAVIFLLTYFSIMFDDKIY